MKKRDKILITGSRGMVGKNLVNKLIESGYTNLFTPSSKKLNLMKREDIFEYFKEKKPKYVFHLAAKVGGIKANIDFPVEFLRDNLLINTNVIDASYNFGVDKLINLGSSCIYPKKAPQPMKEEYLLSGPLEPTNEGYALSKITSLKLCKYYNKTRNTDFISLIPPNMYGRFERFDEENSHVLAALLKRFHEAKLKNKKEVVVWGDGSAKREFLYAEDMARILILSMENLNCKNLYKEEFLNCGSGEEISISDLAKTIEKITQFKGKIIYDPSKPAGMQRKVLDSSRFSSLGFNDFTNLEEGLKKTYKYFLEAY